MNTRFEYMYRDGENYKQYNEVVLEGAFTLDQLRPYLYEGQFFLPSEVGLDDLQEYPYRHCDHIWHEMVSADLTDDAPTVEVRAEEFVARFERAGGTKWANAAVNARSIDFT